MNTTCLAIVDIDVELESRYFEVLINESERNPNVACVGGAIETTGATHLSKLLWFW